MHTEVDVPNPNRVLVEGMYARGYSCCWNVNHAALAVPLQAVDQPERPRQRAGGDSGQPLEERKLTWACKMPAYAEVLAGLKDGEQVVVSDRGALKPGQPVRPQTVDLINYEGRN